MDMRQDAEGAMIAVKMRVTAVHERKAGPPHERSIAENPEIHRIPPRRTAFETRTGRPSIPPFFGQKRMI
jgi:hypothetical protein